MIYEKFLRDLKLTFIESIKEEIMTTPNDKGEVKVIGNPTIEEFNDTLQGSKYELLRGIISNNNLFIWDANDGTHDYVFYEKIKNSEGLISHKKLPVKEIDARLVIDSISQQIEIDNFLDYEKTKKRTLSNDVILNMLQPFYKTPLTVKQEPDTTYFVY